MRLGSDSYPMAEANKGEVLMPCKFCGVEEVVDYGDEYVCDECDDLHKLVSSEDFKKSLDDLTSKYFGKGLIRVHLEPFNTGGRHIYAYIGSKQSDADLRIQIDTVNYGEVAFWLHYPTSALIDLDKANSFRDELKELL